jgi:hypothetical protein
MNTALLALETRVEAFLWFGSYVVGYGPDIIWEYVVTGYLRVWDCTTMIWNENEIVLICSLAIVIHSDVTPSYAMMRSDRRGLWWICNEFKPLPAYTTMVVSSWFSFKDFSQVFPMRDYGFYIEWCTIMMIFVRVFSQWGFLGLYFSVQSKTVSWALVSRIGLRGVFDGTVDGLVA